MAAGKYNRSTLSGYAALGQHDEPLQLLWQAPSLSEPSVTPELPRTDTLPFAGIALQRNPAPANNSTYGLMGFVGGAAHVHSHASGMSMELFGMGEVMGAKAGTETYGSTDQRKLLPALRRQQHHHRQWRVARRRRLGRLRHQHGADRGHGAAAVCDRGFAELLLHLQFVRR